jgi:hypothetical protein
MTPLDNPNTGEQLGELLQTLMPTSGWSNWQGLPVMIGPGNGTFRFDPNESNPYGGRLQVPGTWGSDDYRWTFADTVTWTKGSHSFKFGADIRLTKAQSQMNGDGSTDLWFPTAWGGDAVYATPTGLSVDPTAWPGLVGFDLGSYISGSYRDVYDLMNYMTGSLSAVRQYYFVSDSSAQNWSDPSTEEGQTRYVRGKQWEYSFFFKDDWKVNRDLTLNLGLRYEYYGVPWLLDGMTVGVVGGAERMFGGQDGGFDQWLRGVPAFDPNNLTQQHFIGPGSDNPDLRLFNKDLNNFGPAVGFAWQLPFFGRGKTTLRGGYQMNFTQISRLDPNTGMMNAAGSQPGLLYTHTYGGDITHPYLDLSMMQNLVPTSRFWDGSVVPLAIRPLTDGTQNAAVYDPNVRSPYIQSLTLALTRQIGSSLTVDVRYIGTLSRKQISFVDLNQANWLKNGLKEAFDAARAGGESALLNQLIPPYSFNNYPWEPPLSGAEQLRTSFWTSENLATGDYNAVADALGTSNGNYVVPSTVQGELVRRSGLGENFIYTNRQFAGAWMYGNLNNSNYHSLQGQVTLRPTHGLNFQATYTWSRSLGNRGDNTDPLNRVLDYGILGQHRSHMLTTYGTYNLPFGPSGYVFRGSSGWVKKLVEGWQLSWVSSMTSGLPYSVTIGGLDGFIDNTVYTMHGGAHVDLVNPDLFDTKGGNVTWEPGARSGRYFGSIYTQVDDPQCDHVAAGLQDSCRNGLNALALASDPSKIVFQHAQPGVRGNFDPNSITSVGRWSLDIAASKNIEFMEGKFINFRVDVNNIFNHPTPSGTAPFTYDQRTYAAGSPVSNLNNTTEPFGYIGYKVGHRVFSAKLRISF